MLTLYNKKNKGEVRTKWVGKSKGKRKEKENESDTRDISKV